MNQGVLKRLASIGFAASCGLVDPAVGLAELPAHVVIESLESVGDEAHRWAPSDLGALIELVSRDRRVQVRERVAELAGSMGGAVPPGAALALLQTLSLDDSARVRAAAARGLMRVLERTPMPERVDLVASWATSQEPRRRAALAYALAADLPTQVVLVALEQLAGDEDPDVRVAALAAATAHYHRAPIDCARLAHRLVDDAHPRVRAVAHRLLRR